MAAIDLRKFSPAPEAPIYRQLKEWVKESIKEGVLKPGDVLPAESEFQSALKISRTTVRQCFSQLEAEGFVLRRRGKGTFVTEPKLIRSLNNLYSFTFEMKMLGLHPRSKVLEFATVKPDDLQCGYFGIEENEPLYKIKRLRLANGEPMILETAYIPQKLCPELAQADLSSDSLYAMITEHTGQPPSKAVESYEAIVLTEKTSKILGCPAGSPAFRIVRKSQNSTGQVFEVCTLIVRGDKNRYEVTLKRDNISFTREITGAGPDK